ncbi:MAG: MerR family transcriptional regulator [bacterium]
MQIPEKNFFSIGEASKITGVKPYVLRYWESEFRLLRPARRESGHRKYTPKDLELIGEIKELLYENKFSIAGAKKYLLEERKNKKQQLRLDLEKDSAAISVLRETKKTIKEILKMLEKE